MDLYFNDPHELHEGFVVDSVQKADWALRKIKEAEAERDMLVSFHNDQINKVTADTAQSVARLTMMLRKYFESVPHKKAKTQESFTLPAGKLVYKYEQQVLKETDELLKFLKDNGLTEYVKEINTEDAAWGEFKKTLSIIDGQVVTIDGLLIDKGVAIETKPAEFKAVVEK